jgi:hypothetical protein
VSAFSSIFWGYISSRILLKTDGAKREEKKEIGLDKGNEGRGQNLLQEEKGG